MNIFTLVVLVVAIMIQATRISAQERKPEAPPDPLNKVFFGADIHRKGRPPSVLRIEVDSGKKCGEEVERALAMNIPDDAVAIEVYCIKEKNADKPS